MKYKYNDLIYIKNGQMLGRFLLYREDKKTILVERILSNSYFGGGYSDKIVEISEKYDILTNKEDIKIDFEIKIKDLNDKLIILKDQFEQAKQIPIKLQIENLQQEIINTQKNMQKLDLSIPENILKMNNLIKSITEKNKGIRHLESKSKKVYHEEVNPIISEIKRFEDRIKEHKNLMTNILNRIKS